MKPRVGMGTGAVGRERAILRAIVGLVMAIFVAGSFCAGWFFVARTADGLRAMSASPARVGSEAAAGAEAPSVTAEEPGDQAAVPSKPTSDPRYAFLLLGYGGGAHDGAYLTDSMMVVIVDPSQKTLTMLSIPRDAWVPMIFNGQTAIYNKVNTGYAFAKDPTLYTDRLPRYRGAQGAGTLVMDTIARLTGIPISYYLALDFDGFRQMIDLVGGIDIDVPDSFTANYPLNDDPEIDPRWTTVRFTKGPQHMNGERAIQYARAREVIDNISEGSDFARSRRQRLIIEAFKARLVQPSGMVRIPQLIAAAAGHVDTNYSIPSAAQLAQFVTDWENVRFFQTALTAQDYLSEATGPQGMYILVPDTADYSWAPIRALGRTLWENPALGVAMAGTEIVVENDSGVVGLGGRLSSALAMLGYRVGTPVTGATRTSSRVLDHTGVDDNSLMVQQLEKDLGLQLPVSADNSSGGVPRLVLQVGSDDARLDSFSVPPDPSAPSSAVGLVRSGSWVPLPDSPAPAPTATAPTATRGPAVGTATPGTPMPGPAATAQGTSTVRPSGSPAPLATPSHTAVALAPTPTLQPAARTPTPVHPTPAPTATGTR